MNIGKNKTKTGFFFTTCAMAIILFSALTLDTALAQYKEGTGQNIPGHQQGFTGPTVDPTTVAQALDAKDDTPVVLKGNIVKALGSELYLFKDSTGEIHIEIDMEDWRGQQVGPNDTVTIYGEVDTEWNRPVEIDVDQIIKN